jgi:hypothetical protein
MDTDYGPNLGHPEDPRNDFDDCYCDCDLERDCNELASGRCDACGGILRDDVDPQEREALLADEVMGELGALEDSEAKGKGAFV